MPLSCNPFRKVRASTNRSLGVAIFLYLLVEPYLGVKLAFLVVLILVKSNVLKLVNISVLKLVNVIQYVLEAQNITRSHVKLIMGNQYSKNYTTMVEIHLESMERRMIGIKRIRFGFKLILYTRWIGKHSY